MAAAGQDRNAHLRQILRPYRAKADAFAVSLFAADCAMYAICTVVAAAHLAWFVRFLAGTAAGVLLAVLFVVGHDACHGSFTSRRLLNAAIWPALARLRCQRLQTAITWRTPVPDTTCHMSISLDGLVAGPDQSREPGISLRSVSQANATASTAPTR